MTRSESPPEPPKRRTLTVRDYVEGVRAGDRTVLARAITLTESSLASDRVRAGDVLTALMPETGQSIRVGLTGVPGVGKSTFIEALGGRLTGAGHRVAVLAVDPSSGISGGSILGDKTRMGGLAVDPNAFIRPSPAAGTLGGVAARTRESMLLCEGAGFDVVIVETVGVGQSETVVAEMTDSFVALMLPGAGDELQGIKRGLMELADVIAVNKADGETRAPAERAARELRSALRLLHPPGGVWTPPVLVCSALTGDGVDEVWNAVTRHRRALSAAGALEERRRAQALRWMWTLVDDGLRTALRRDDAVQTILGEVRSTVLSGQLPPTVAARQLLDRFLGPSDR